MSGTSVFQAWLAREPFAQSLLGPDWRDPAQRREVVRRAASRKIDPRLSSVLRTIDRRLPPSKARVAQLAKLERGGCAAVLTGQQVGLYLGPLYTLWKAASAIRLADELEQETGIPCVPIFWAATEDHDAAEVDHAFVRGPRKISIPLADDRTPVGPREITIDPAVLDEYVDSAELRAMLDASYHDGASMGDAFLSLLARVFERQGLVLFEPRAEGVAQIVAPVYRHAFEQRAKIEGALLDRCRRIEQAGLTVQVPPRESTTLFFHHVQGARHRWVEHDGRFSAAAEHIDAATMIDRLEREPASFSSSVLLRPIVQDSLFPTVAYVGGPAECSYFAELAPIYEALDVPMPLVVPRARITLVSARERRALDKLGCTVAHVPRLDVTETLPEAARPDAMLAELEAHLVALERAEPQLHRALERTRGTVRRAVSRLATKHAGILAARDDAAIARVAQLKAILFPNEAPQERVYSFIPFADTIGVDALVDAALAAIDPFDPTPIEISI